MPKVRASDKAKLKIGTLVPESGTIYIYHVICDKESAKKFMLGEKIMFPVTMLQLLVKFHKRL